MPGEVDMCINYIFPAGEPWHIGRRDNTTQRTTSNVTESQKIMSRTVQLTFLFIIPLVWLASVEKMASLFSPIPLSDSFSIFIKKLRKYGSIFSGRTLWHTKKSSCDNSLSCRSFKLDVQIDVMVQQEQLRLIFKEQCNDVELVSRKLLQSSEVKEKSRTCSYLLREKEMFIAFNVIIRPLVMC